MYYLYPNNHMHTTAPQIQAHNIPDKQYNPPMVVRANDTSIINGIREFGPHHLISDHINGTKTMTAVMN
jgi:hypothetical protein